MSMATTGEPLVEVAFCIPEGYRPCPALSPTGPGYQPYSNWQAAQAACEAHASPDPWSCNWHNYAPPREGGHCQGSPGSCVRSRMVPLSEAKRLLELPAETKTRAEWYLLQRSRVGARNRMQVRKSKLLPILEEAKLESKALPTTNLAIGGRVPQQVARLESQIVLQNQQQPRDGSYDGYDGSDLGEADLYPELQSGLFNKFTYPELVQAMTREEVGRITGTRDPQLKKQVFEQMRPIVARRLMEMKRPGSTRQNDGYYDGYYDGTGVEEVKSQTPSRRTYRDICGSPMQPLGYRACRENPKCYWRSGQGCKEIPVPGRTSFDGY